MATGSRRKTTIAMATGAIAIALILALPLFASCGRVSFDFPGDDAGGLVDGPATTLSDQSSSPTCTGTETACGSDCAELISDPSHCGACGVRCEGATPVCDRGRCAAECSSGLTNCAGACVDLTSDSKHCSACGTACAVPEICVTSTCNCPANKTRCGSTCVDLRSNPLHCGGCGRRCDGATPVCNDSECRPSCTAGRTSCSGACVDLKTDPEHCGDCSAVCADGYACDKSSCTCLEGQILCGNRCVTSASDRNNCGACGRGCPASSVCEGGICR